ncbi:MAG: TIGR02679 domain-containing protein [Defluviitaleaceae bacterium]|nr:TIGR02679 domain-containing protein [Defluviitaleaceae bacterium]
MSTSNGLAEIIQYFKNDSGFERLMSGMFDLYNRYGRCFSAVRLSRPTIDEEKALSKFFNRDYYDQVLIRIGLAEFERQVHKVFKHEVSLATILETYFGRTITSYSEPVSDTNRYKDAFTRTIRDNVLPKYEETPAAAWLVEMLAHMRRTYRQWADQYPHEPDNVLTMVSDVCEAINALPQAGQLIRLSDFAAQYLDDSRALDFHSPMGPLFLRALAHRFQLAVPTVLEDSIRLYLQAGLLSDGVLSQVTVRGIKAEDEACILYDQLGEAHVLTLENICRLNSASAYGEKVFVIENPHVFSALCERLSGQNCTLICASGGLNPALERLLELCVESGATIYYAGNIDYKGLTLADKIYLRFGKQFIPWRYGKADYEMLFSGSDYLLPDDRKDLAMHNEDLAALLSLLRKKGKSASSLPLVGLLAEDIRAMLGME